MNRTGNCENNTAATLLYPDSEKKCGSPGACCELEEKQVGVLGLSREQSNVELVYAGVKVHNSASERVRRGNACKEKRCPLR